MGHLGCFQLSLLIGYSGCFPVVFFLWILGYFQAITIVFIAVVTNSQTFSGLKQHKCILLQFWRLEPETRAGSFWRLLPFPASGKHANYCFCHITFTSG